MSKSLVKKTFLSILNDDDSQPNEVLKSVSVTLSDLVSQHNRYLPNSVVIQFHDKYSFIAAGFNDTIQQCNEFCKEKGLTAELCSKVKFATSKHKRNRTRTFRESTVEKEFRFDLKSQVSMDVLGKIFNFNMNTSKWDINFSKIIEGIFGDSKCCAFAMARIVDVTMNEEARLFAMAIKDLFPNENVKAECLDSSNYINITNLKKNMCDAFVKYAIKYNTMKNDFKNGTNKDDQPPVFVYHGYSVSYPKTGNIQLVKLNDRYSELRKFEHTNLNLLVNLVKSSQSNNKRLYKVNLVAMQQEWFKLRSKLNIRSDVTEENQSNSLGLQHMNSWIYMIVPTSYDIKISAKKSFNLQKSSLKDITFMYICDPNGVDAYSFNKNPIDYLRHHQSHLANQVMGFKTAKSKASRSNIKNAVNFAHVMGWNGPSMNIHVQDIDTQTLQTDNSDDSLYAASDDSTESEYNGTSSDDEEMKDEDIKDESKFDEDVVTTEINESRDKCEGVFSTIDTSSKGYGFLDGKALFSDTSIITLVKPNGDLEMIPPIEDDNQNHPQYWFYDIHCHLRLEKDCYVLINYINCFETSSSLIVELEDIPWNTRRRYSIKVGKNSVKENKFDTISDKITEDYMTMRVNKHLQSSDDEEEESIEGHVLMNKRRYYKIGDSFYNVAHVDVELVNKYKTNVTRTEFNGNYHFIKSNDLNKESIKLMIENCVLNNGYSMYCIIGHQKDRKTTSKEYFSAWQYLYVTRNEVDNVQKNNEFHVSWFLPYEGRYEAYVQAYIKALSDNELNQLEYIRPVLISPVNSIGASSLSHNIKHHTSVTQKEAICGFLLSTDMVLQRGYNITGMCMGASMILGMFAMIAVSSMTSKKNLMQKRGSDLRDNMESYINEFVASCIHSVNKKSNLIYQLHKSDNLSLRDFYKSNDFSYFCLQSDNKKKRKNRPKKRKLSRNEQLAVLLMKKRSRLKVSGDSYRTSDGSTFGPIRRSTRLNRNLTECGKLVTLSGYVNENSNKIQPVGTELAIDGVDIDKLKDIMSDDDIKDEMDQSSKKSRKKQNKKSKKKKSKKKSQKIKYDKQEIDEDDDDDEDEDDSSD